MKHFSVSVALIDGALKKVHWPRPIFGGNPQKGEEIPDSLWIMVNLMAFPSTNSGTTTGFPLLRLTVNGTTNTERH